MIQATVAPAMDPFLASLFKGHEAPAGAHGVAVTRLRSEAASRLAGMALPTIKDEEWRFTNLAPLKAIAFHPAPTARPLTLADLTPWLLPEAANSRLVFVNGVFTPHLSDTSGLPAGVVVRNLPEGAPPEKTLVEAHLGQYARFHESVFTALNTAFLGEGAIVVLPRNTTCHVPIHLLFVTQPGANPPAVYPRCLVVAETNAVGTVIQEFASLGEGPAFTDAVTEVVVGEDARLTHVMLQRENLAAFHIGHSAVSLDRNAVYTSTAITLGAAFSRQELNVVQTAEGVDCTLNGLALIGGGQFADTHSAIDHAQPHGTSRQVHKCILDGKARAVFNGKILVRQGAQQTDSSQASRNLLLSDGARIDAKPQLEIFADDVKCAHGATVGQLDPEEVFYLQSRGLAESAARHLLTYAFAAEILDQIPVASLRQRLCDQVMAQMPATPLSRGGL